MNNHQRQAQEPPWRKGKMRDEQEATRCQHLGVHSITPIVQQHSGIKDVMDQPIMKAQIAGAPTLLLTCTSPEIVRFSCAQIPISLHAQIRVVVTSLPLCRLCPFWEEVKKNPPGPT